MTSMTRAPVRTPRTLMPTSAATSAMISAGHDPRGRAGKQGQRWSERRDHVDTPAAADMPVVQDQAARDEPDHRTERGLDVRIRPARRSHPAACFREAQDDQADDDGARDIRERRGRAELQRPRMAGSAKMPLPTV